MKKNSKESEGQLYRIEAHLWFENFDEFLSKEKDLHELLGQLHGNASIIIFFRSTPEYLEIPGACYDHMSDEQAGQLIDYCGRDNIDFVVRLSRDTWRKKGCLLHDKKRRNE